MKKTALVLVVIIAALTAYGVYVRPERLENLQLVNTSSTHELLGYDLVSDRYQVKDARIKTTEDVIKNLRFTDWDNRKDDADFVTLQKQLFKWPMRYDYSLKISKPAADGSIELWYVIDGSLVWYHKVQPLG